MENAYQQFIDEAGSIFEPRFAMMRPELAEANVSEPSEQNGMGAIFQRSLPGRTTADSPGETVRTTATGPSPTSCSASFRLSWGGQDNIYFACSDPSGVL